MSINSARPQSSGGKLPPDEELKYPVEFLLKAAKQHGDDSDPDHETGDLQDHMRRMWEILSPAQRAHFMALPDTREAVELGFMSMADGVYEAWVDACKVPIYPAPKKYNHALTIAFEVRSDNDGENLNAEELFTGLSRRLDSLAGTQEIVEACGMPFNTVENETPPPRRPGPRR